MFVKQIRVESLGNSSYLVGSQEAKVCAVVDPLRDVDVYTREADALGGRVPGALHVELGDLPEHVDGLPRDRSYATLCAAGVRASTAASILEREGFEDVAVVVGGTEAWRQAGYPMEKDE